MRRLKSELMKQKIGKYIITIALLCLCGALCAFAAGCGGEDMGSAERTDTGLLLAPNADGWTVLGGETGLTEIVVPDEHAGLPVTAIAAGAFKGGAAETLTVGANVTAIGGGAFADCKKLTSVTLPAGLTEIGVAPFKNCGRLTDAELPAGALAALDTLALRRVTLNGGAELPAYAFADCASLERVTLPDGLTAVGADAFRGCKSLAYVSLPDSLAKVGCGAFYNCGAGAEVRFRGELEDWCDITFGDAAANPLGCAAEAYFADEPLTALTIPSSVTAVGNYAFSGYKPLTSVNFHDGLESIGASAFCGCTALTGVTLNDGLTAIGASAFASSGLTALTLPAGVAYLGASTFASCPDLADISVAAGNTAYYAAGDCLFERASDKLILGCKNSVIPSDVTEIGAYAFAGCTAETLTLPAGLTTIGDRAFYNCGGVRRFTVPRGVTAIGKSAFERCGSLLNLTLETPDGWFRTQDAAAPPVNGFAVTGLADTFVAARFLTSTYASYYWKR